MARDRSASRQVRRTSIVIVIVLAIAFVVVQTSPLVRNAFIPVRAGMDDIIVRASAATEGASGWGFGSDQKLRDEIETLKRENRQLSIWRDASLSMAERMQRYEELLGLTGDPLPQGVSARVVTETAGPFAETRLANAGRRNGVSVGDVAINTNGLVGRVIRVGERSSRILLVTDFNSRVPVMGEISGVRAILAGGEDEFHGQLIDKPERDDLLIGESLLTTGEGNAFPRGLQVGIVVPRNNDLQAYLSMSEAPLDFVRLIATNAIPSPEEEPALIATTPEAAPPPAPVEGGEG